MKGRLHIHNENYVGLHFGPPMIGVSPATFFPKKRWFRKHEPSVDGYAVMQTHSHYDSMTCSSDYFWHVVKFFPELEDAMEFKRQLQEL